MARVPILEVTVPLHGRDPEELFGAAQFIVEGHSLAEEYGCLDRHLAQVAAWTFLVAGGFMAGLLWPAFRHVERLNMELAQRSERLLRANKELARAARAVALGAVSAHLMYGLKNPLASPSQFVAARADANGVPNDADWQDALTTTRRLRARASLWAGMVCLCAVAPFFNAVQAEIRFEVLALLQAAAPRQQRDGPAGGA